MSQLDYSENEDDPDVYESSGSEWSSSELEPIKKRPNRRSSTRNKQPRKKADTSSSESEVDDPKPRKKNGVNKRPKLEYKSKTPTTKTVESSYSTGSFLVSKKDIRVGDPNKPPCIWRVDGKALLQKYEPFEENGKTKHRTTSVYTGWSPMDRDLYLPVTVSARQQSNTMLIVELDWDKLKEIDMEESD